MDREYHTYLHLRSIEREGLDYRVRSRGGSTGIAVMAPHGGDIEPGTTELAEAVAGERHAFYSFEGLKPDRNMSLHIASTLFDEPEGLRIASEAVTVITFHGCRESAPVVLIGGLDVDLRQALEEGLNRAGFTVREDPRLPGRSPSNLCNRSRRGRGVQVEVSRGLRRDLFSGLRRREREVKTALFDRLVAAFRAAVEPSH